MSFDAKTVSHLLKMPKYHTLSNDNLVRLCIHVTYIFKTLYGNCELFFEFVLQPDPRLTLCKTPGNGRVTLNVILSSFHVNANCGRD